MPSPKITDSQPPLILVYLDSFRMKILLLQRVTCSWMSLFTMVIFYTGISTELKSNRLVRASEPSVPIASQAPTYLRRRTTSVTGRYRSWHGEYSGLGMRALRRTPWYPGGFFYPPVHGSWYQRPYPYHFDIYRRQPTYTEEIVPNAVR